MAYCDGAWFNYPFQIVNGVDTTDGPATWLTVAYGPTDLFRNVTPSVTLQFHGSAIYYYTVVSAWTATMAITIDDGTPAIVNLTKTMKLNSNTLYDLEVMAWQMTGLDPVKEHKFYLEWAETPGKELEAFVGFNKVVITQDTTNGTTVDNSTEKSRTTLNLPNGMTKTLLTPDPSSPKKERTSQNLVIAAVAGSVGGIVIIILVIAWFTRRANRNNAARNSNAGDWKPIFDSERTSGTYINLDEGASGKSRYARWDDETPLNPYAPVYTLPGSETPHTGRLDQRLDQHGSTVHVPLLDQDDGRHSVDTRRTSR
ncbi:hypothetical protein FRC03_009885 [Tulasnella sp. 419]|nr:hypothetical protein FRC03_009885 [Tulasnella sp. 419]